MRNENLSKCCRILGEICLVQTHTNHVALECTIVNSEMVRKPGELQSVYNELRFYVELASPCTNLLKFPNMSGLTMKILYFCLC